MPLSHASYTRPYLAGTIAVSPARTAASAGPASGAARTNHCSETIGSMTSPPRCDRGTLRARGAWAPDALPRQ
jgi:hypothetical protein